MSFIDLRRSAGSSRICQHLAAGLLAAALAVIADGVGALATEPADPSVFESSANSKVNSLAVGRSADAPDIIGVYLSHGYWQPMEIEEVMTELESLGVNTVIDYALTLPEDSHWQWGFEAYLNSAKRHGIGVVFYLGGLLDGATPTDSGEHFKQVTATVAALKHHPQITAWYVHDEVLPMVHNELATVQYTLSLTQMQALYQAIRAEDPTRPQLNVWAQLPTYDQFDLVFSASDTPFGRPDWLAGEEAFEKSMRKMVRETCDWVLVDSYPIGAQWRDHEKLPELAFVDAITFRANGLRSSHQPLYFVFQSFSWAQYGQAAWLDAPFPTYAQMRDMLGVASRNGAQGAIAYSWFDLTKNIPGRDIPGRERCLDDLRRVLTMLSSRGWPTELVRLPYENTSDW